MKILFIFKFVLPLCHELLWPLRAGDGPSPRSAASLFICSLRAQLGFAWKIARFFDLKLTPKGKQRRLECPAATSAVFNYPNAKLEKAQCPSATFPHGRQNKALLSHSAYLIANF